MSEVSEPQESPAAAATPERVGNALILREGWALPELANYEQSGEPMAVVINKKRVRKTEFKPIMRMLIDATRPQLTDAGSTEFESWEVSKMVLFETLDGKPICQYIDGIKATHNSANLASMVVGLDFCDDDGDGAFEELNFGPVGEAPTTFPAWLL
jgi:hypothetical protein